MNSCFYCGKDHTNFFGRRSYPMSEIAKKSSFEVLILILEDMRQFLIVKTKDPTMQQALNCFCKFSISIANEESVGPVNKLHTVAFEAVSKLIERGTSINEIEACIINMKLKLWEEHEKLLIRINEDTAGGGNARSGSNAIFK